MADRGPGIAKDTARHRERETDKWKQREKQINGNRERNR